MKTKTYLNTTALIFAVIGFVHLLRVANVWTVEVEGNAIPMWISWAAVFAGGYFAYWGFKFGE